MRNDAGFSLIELLLVIVVLSILFAAIPGLDHVSLFKIADQDEVQRLVDLMRWAQRRAILTGERYYLTLNPVSESYKIYQLVGAEERVFKQVNLENLDIVGINRSVDGMEQTFYYNPEGAPSFGCSITLKNRWNTWKVVIAVATGKIRIDKE